MAVTWIDASETNDPSDPNAEYAAAAASWILYKLTTPTTDEVPPTDAQFLNPKLVVALGRSVVICPSTAAPVARLVTL